MKRTISVMVGKGSVRHNSRAFHAANTDPERSDLNIEYCNEDIRDVYHELFDDAVARYNAKQKRSDRCIDDYYEKIRSGRQEKPFHEVILQIGNKDDCGAVTDEGKLAAEVLDEYMQDFQKRNPTLRVFSAHLHMDEATPHLHIDFVPYITGSSRGVDTRVSLKQALAALGFKGGTRRETEWSQWVNAEKEQLAEVMERHGIEWEHLGTHEEHLSVLDYKKEERAKEVADLEKQKSSLIEQNAKLEKETNTNETKAENAEKRALKAEEKMDAMTTNINQVESYAADFVRDPKEWLPEPNTLESAKTYQSRILPVIDKVIKCLRPLYSAYLKVKQKCQQLTYRIQDLDERINRLSKKLSRVEGENQKLKVEAQDFERVKSVLGAPTVNDAIEVAKQKELMNKREKSKRERSLLNR